MNRALLPALIAGIFASSCAMAAERELLFGPSGMASASEARNVDKPAAPKAAVKPMKSDKADRYVVAEKTIKASLVEVQKTEKDVKGPKVKKVAEAPIIEKKTSSTSELSKTAVKGIEPVSLAPKAIATVAAIAPASVVTEIRMVDKKLLTNAPAFLIEDKNADLSPLTPEASKFTASSVSITPGSDPFSVREQLRNKIKQEVSIGFFPSGSRESSSYNFLHDYLPLSNFMSQQSGVLINLVPEREVKSYARQIEEQLYPVIFVNSFLSEYAKKSGYTPLVVSEEKISAYFVVKDDSIYKSIDDIKGAKISFSRNSKVSDLAFADLAKHKINQTSNKIIDVGTSGRSGAIDLFKSGAADVVVLSSVDAQKFVDDSNGKLRFIASDLKVASSSVWVRKDVAGSHLANSLEAALLTLGSESSVSAKMAKDGFLKGYGNSAKFLAPSKADEKSNDDAYAVSTAAFPSIFFNIDLNKSALSENLSKPVLVQVEVALTNDSLMARKKIADSFKESLSVGFFPSANADPGTFRFLKDFMPFSNYISQSSGVLVNLIPERVAASFKKRIFEQTYPVIFVNTSLAESALAAGYVQVAVGEEKVSPGFLVLDSSKIKTIDDIKGVKIALSKNSQTSYLAFADLAKSKIYQGANKIIDVSSVGKSSAIDFLTSSKVDVAVVRAQDGVRVAAESNGKIRHIESSISFPAVGMWMRKDFYASKLATSVANSVISVDSDTNESSKAASEGFKSGFGVKGKFLSSNDEQTINLSKLFESVNKSYPDEFKKVEFDDKKSKTNINRSALEPVSHAK